MLGGTKYNTYNPSAPFEETMPIATAEPVGMDASMMAEFQQWQKEQQFREFMAWQQQQQTTSQQHNFSQLGQFQQWQTFQQQQQYQEAKISSNEPTIACQGGQGFEKPAPSHNSTQQAGMPSSNPATRNGTTTNATSSSNSGCGKDSQDAGSSANGGFSLFGVIDNATAQVNKINAAQNNTKTKVQNLGQAVQNLVSGFSQIFGTCSSDACTSVSGKF